jgi:hypothetical protein
MKQKRPSEGLGTDTTVTIPQLIFQLNDGLQRASDALFGLAGCKAFAHQSKSLHEDAEQLREFRGDMLDYILETWRDVETDEADDLRAKRRTREQREREADLASIAKAQARLKQGTVTPIKREPKMQTNAKGKTTRIPRQKRTKAKVG